MRYIACDGQVSMSALGYSPLPPNLSQEMMNSVGRLTGAAPSVLSAANCSNPRFKGSLGSGATSPCDPFVCGGGSGPSTGGAVGSPAAAGAAGGGGSASPGTQGAGGTTNSAGTRSGKAGSTGTTTTQGTRPSGTLVARGQATPGAVSAQKGANGGAVVALGGSDAATWRAAEPVKFTSALPTDPYGWLPAVLVLVALLAPIVVVRRRRSSGDPGWS